MSIYIYTDYITISHLINSVTQFPNDEDTPMRDKKCQQNIGGTAA